MRLSTDGVCIKLLTVLKSRVLHSTSLCPFGFTTRGGGFAGRDANLSPQQSRRARRARVRDNMVAAPVPTGNQIRAARMMQCFCLTRRTQAGSKFGKRQQSFLHKQNGPGFGAISVLPCRLVATALFARDCAAVAPIDRSGHHAAILPWADGDTAWADSKVSRSSICQSEEPYATEISGQYYTDTAWPSRLRSRHSRSPWS